jgi:hypothetical protein
MKCIILSFSPLLFVSVFASCASNDRFEVGGVPKWISRGGKVSEEPSPRQPDNAVILHKRVSGPVRFSFNTDDYRYPAPPKKKVEKVDTRDPLEQGRDRRINRLVR